MITYEITAKVRPDLCEKYEIYMRERHIPDLLGTDCFSGASLSTDGAGSFRMRYEAPDREALDRYLREHAAPLRKDAEEHFPEGVELSRTEWTIIQNW